MNRIPLVLMAALLALLPAAFPGRPGEAAAAPPLEEVRALFPGAAGLAAEGEWLHAVLDGAGERLGIVIPGPPPGREITSKKFQVLIPIAGHCGEWKTTHPLWFTPTLRASSPRPSRPHFAHARAKSSRRGTPRRI